MLLWFSCSEEDVSPVSPSPEAIRVTATEQLEGTWRLIRLEVIDSAEEIDSSYTWPDSEVPEYLVRYTLDSLFAYELSDDSTCYIRGGGAYTLLDDSVGTAFLVLIPDGAGDTLLRMGGPPEEPDTTANVRYFTRYHDTLPRSECGTDMRKAVQGSGLVHLLCCRGLSISFMQDVWHADVDYERCAASGVRNRNPVGCKKSTPRNGLRNQ